MHVKHELGQNLLIVREKSYLHCESGARWDSYILLSFYYRGRQDVCKDRCLTLTMDIYCYVSHFEI